MLSFREHLYIPYAKGNIKREREKQTEVKRKIEKNESKINRRQSQM